MLIIADIAGQFDALQRLVAKVPEDMKIVLLGDLVDRGHESAEVIEWAIANKHRVRAVLGNHEHMMLDWYDNGNVYGDDVWFANGGTATRASYSRKYGSPRPPDEHLEWLRNLPYAIQEDGVLMTHAPLNKRHSLEEMLTITKDQPLYGRWDGSDGSLLWNRSRPVAREGIFQVFGHNSHWGLASEEGWICLDQSSTELLTGLVWDKDLAVTGKLEILEEPYLRGPEPITVDL